MSNELVNGYEPKSVSRTVFGVLSSLLSMGLPVGGSELFRPGGDLKVAFWGGVATVLAIIFAVLSIRGTMKE